MLRLGLVLISVSLAGCGLFAHGADDAPTDAPRCFVDAIAVRLLNPETLDCQSIGRGSCGSTQADQAPLPPWGRCDSGCETLSEFDCLIADRCRVVYDYDCFTGAGPCTALTPFMGCFPISEQGGGAQMCDGLDSWSCSARIDCVALHRPVCDGNVCWRQFMECRPENR